MAIRVARSPALRWVALATAVAVMVRTAYRRRHEILDASQTLGVGGFVLAAAALVLATAAQWIAWDGLSRAYGSTLTKRASAMVYGIGLVGKYAPGGVWTTLLQMEYSARAGQRRTTFLLSSATAMAVTIVTGLTVGALAIPATAADVSRWAWLAVLALAPAALLLRPRTLASLASRLAPVGQGVGRAPAGATIAAAAGASIVGWMFLGAHLIALGDGAPDLLIASSGYALAWSLGFLAIFAPAGAGVRDVVLFAWLERHMSSDDAVAITLLARSVSIVVDVVIGMAALTAQRLFRNTSLRTPHNEFGEAPT